MNKDFSVYKWRREHLATEPINEALSDNPMVKAIYNEIEKFLDPKEIRVGKSFIEMAIMRGIMTGERNTPPFIDEGQFVVRNKKGKYENEDYDGYYRAESEAEVKSIKDSLKNNKEKEYMGDEKVGDDPLLYFVYFKNK